jgi:hypothetical protein
LHLERNDLLLEYDAAVLDLAEERAPACQPALARKRLGRRQLLAQLVHGLPRRVQPPPVLRPLLSAAQRVRHMGAIKK